MSETQRIESPDRRYYLLLVSTEMRMSHWVTGATLWQRAPQRQLLQLGDGLWSCEQVVWSADSQAVAVSLRRYPGDAPSIMLDLHPERQIAIARAPADAQPLPFAELTAFLERWYTSYSTRRSY